MLDEERFDKFEQRVEALGKRIEEVAERIGQKVEARVETSARCSPHRERGRIFWGLAFVVAGFIWLGNRMDWFRFDVPIAATVLIILGLYMIVTARHR